jgi:hypothetical protein
LRDWIIISPEGMTYGPNFNRYENFQVLGFVKAGSEQAALHELEEKYSYLRNSGFGEVWIYPLEKKSAYITYLTLEPLEVEFEDDIEKEIVEKITHLLTELDFNDIEYDYRDNDSYYFEVYSDALGEVRVDIDGDVAKVYDRYFTEKHFVYYGNFIIK